MFRCRILSREGASLGSNGDKLHMDGNVLTGDELVPNYWGFSEGLVSGRQFSWLVLTGDELVPTYSGFSKRVVRIS